MQFQIATIILAAATLGSCTPMALHKRDECQLQGWYSISQCPIAGMLPNPDDASGFTLTYTGGKTLGSSQFNGNGESGGSNPIGIGGVTIQPWELGLRNPLQWKPDFNLFTFEGCQVTYEGQTYKGKAGGTENGVTSRSFGTVAFGCESGLT